MSAIRPLLRHGAFLGLAVFTLRCLAAGGWSPNAMAGAFDAAGTWSLPVSAAAVILGPREAGLAGALLAAISVLGVGWAAGRLARLSGAGPRVTAAAALLPGLLLPAGAPLGKLAPALLAGFALAGLAGAVAAHLERSGPMILLELMLWSDLLALVSPDWIWVAIALCLAFVPLVAGRGRGRVEAPLAVLVAGGAWAVILRALVEGGLRISDRPPISDGGPWMVALLGISATIVLVVALTLLVTGRSEYGLTVALAVTGLAALIDVAVPGISAPAGLAAVAALPALGGLAWKGITRPLAGAVEPGP